MADGLAAVALAMVQRGEGVPEDTDLRLAFRWGIVPANAGEKPSAELGPRKSGSRRRIGRSWI